MDAMNRIWTPDQELRALSWKQPYGELMLYGKIETRTWPTKYRGWVLMCASKQPYFTDQLKRISGVDQMWRMGYYLPENPSHYEGNAFAIGYLVDCRPMQKEDENNCFVQYYPDLFCHVYENVYPINLIPWKGSQGWKKVDEATKKLIKYL